MTERNDPLLYMVAHESRFCEAGQSAECIPFQEGHPLALQKQLSPKEPPEPKLWRKEKPDDRKFEKAQG